VREVPSKRKLKVLTKKTFDSFLQTQVLRAYNQTYSIPYSDMH
jgi:hypothetical protein